MEKDLSSLISLFQEFFRNYYREKIDELSLVYPSKKSLEVDYNILSAYNPELADVLIQEPEITLEAAKSSITEMNISIPKGAGLFSPNIRFYNVPGSDTLIENLSSGSLGQLVSFKGVVTKRTDIMHRVKIAEYVCEACEQTYRFVVKRDFKPPRKCESCKKFALVPVESKSKYADVQKAEVQEMLEKVKGGSPASKIELWLEEDLVNRIVPGENIEVVGILRLKEPLRLQQKKDLIYGRYAEVIHLKSIKKDFEEIDLTKEDIRRIKELAKDQEVKKKIISSIAPAIYGYTEVKHALALQLFGGTRGKMLKGGAPIRDDIHLLLIGDPGIAKSRFLQSVTAIAPKSIYISGKSVSAAGLTATAERDEMGEGGWTLKAGALVIASGGIVSLDEFDKIRDEDRAALHEVMESGSVSLAKAGMVAKFRAKTAIVAAANPKHGRFNQKKNLADQFDIAPSLLSRFDLLFPIVDVLDEEKDAKLAEYILKSHMEGLSADKFENDGFTIDKDLLRKYIAYARRSVKPVLSDEAKDKIKEFYVDLRVQGQHSGSIPITPRYLEGLVRMAEASAKMMLSNVVEGKDAEVAITLLKYSMSKLMIDQETGAFDSDIISVGKSRSQVQKYETIMDIIREKTREYDAVEVKEIIATAKEHGIDLPTASRIIKELQRKGEIYEVEHNWVKPVDKG